MSIVHIYDYSEQLGPHIEFWYVYVSAMNLSLQLLCFMIIK